MSEVVVRVLENPSRKVLGMYDTVTEYRGVKKVEVTFGPGSYGISVDYMDGRMEFGSGLLERDVKVVIMNPGDNDE